MVRIVLDAGHGLHTPGKRTPDDEREWSFNNTVAIAAERYLKEYEGVEVLRVDDRSGKRDVPLKERTDTANRWGADYYVSIHHNALTGAWHNGGGVETFVHPNASETSKRLAKAIHPRIVSAMGIADRGVKQANHHVTRETKMPAVLTEGGFMDSRKDIVAMRNPAKMDAQGRAIAEGLAEVASLSKAVKKASVPSKDGGANVVEYEKDAKVGGALKADFDKAVANEITDGTYPHRPATRAEVAVMIQRMYERLNGK